MKKTLLIAISLFVAASISAKQYPDSIQQASKEEPNIRYGWNFEFAGGLGVGSYEYKQLFTPFTGTEHHVSNKINFPSWNAAFGISYYFVSWMGIGTGAQFTAYTNKAAVTEPWVLNGQYDQYRTTVPDERMSQYNITSTPINLSEIQNIYMLEVPIALKFRARPGVCGFTATLGMKLGFPMMNNYSLSQNGYMDNSVHYPFFDLTLKDVPSVVENINIPQAQGEMEKGAFKLLNYAAYAEIGMLIRVHQRVELAIAAYANYYINDVLSHETPAYDATPLGFGVGQLTGQYPMPYNTAYNGILRTNEVETLHPWNVGLKLGIQINANRTKAQRDWDREQRKLKKQKPEEPKDTVQPEPEPEPEPIVEEQQVQPDPRELAIQQIHAIADQYGINLCEDICVPVPVFLHDTIYLGTDDPSYALDEQLQQAIIYFKLDDATPIIEPADVLVRVANVLKAHPNQKIRINGHACTIGKPAYNKRLAMRRAKAVAKILRELGVKDKQMIVASLGADEPFRYNGEHQLAKDRRVEIVPSNLKRADANAIGANKSFADNAQNDPRSQKQVQPVQEQPKTAAPANFKGTTERVRLGSRLAQIARRHYHETDFWIFIYEANLDKIKNPSDLPTGLEIRIPDLTERLQGMSREEQLQEAARLKQQLLKK